MKSFFGSISEWWRHYNDHHVFPQQLAMIQYNIEKGLFLHLLLLQRIISQNLRLCDAAMISEF